MGRIPLLLPLDVANGVGGDRPRAEPSRAASPDSSAHGVGHLNGAPVGKKSSSQTAHGRISAMGAEGLTSPSSRRLGPGSSNHTAGILDHAAPGQAHRIPSYTSSDGGGADCGQAGSLSNYTSASATTSAASSSVSSGNPRLLQMHSGPLPSLPASADPDCIAPPSQEPSIPTISKRLTGMALARAALSTVNQAEQQLTRVQTPDPTPLLPQGPTATMRPRGPPPSLAWLQQQHHIGKPPPSPTRMTRTASLGCLVQSTQLLAASNLATSVQQQQQQQGAGSFAVNPPFQRHTHHNRPDHQQQQDVNSRPERRQTVNFLTDVEVATVGGGGQQRASGTQRRPDPGGRESPTRLSAASQAGGQEGGAKGQEQKESSPTKRTSKTGMVAGKAAAAVSGAFNRAWGKVAAATGLGNGGAGGRKGADGGAALGAITGSASAMVHAMRAVSELQSLDEYSLVAAARVRQAMTRSLSTMPSRKKLPGLQTHLLRSLAPSSDTPTSPVSSRSLFAAPLPSPPSMGSSTGQQSSLVQQLRQQGANTQGSRATSPSPPGSRLGSNQGEKRSRPSVSPPRATSQSELGMWDVHAATAAAAAEAAASEAMIRALEARFGTVEPDVRVALVEECVLQQRTKQLQEALARANPAAFQEEAAEAAEAAYRALADRVKARVRALQAEPTTHPGLNKQLEDAVREMCSQRPFFLPPVILKPKVERPFIDTGKKVVREVVWSVDDSLFAQRKKENEARDLYDTDKVRMQQLTIDWQRVVTKARFRRLVARGDSGVKNDGQRLDEELAEVREELVRQAPFLRSAFVYYSMMGMALTSDSVLQMGSNHWLAFCNDAGIIHPTQRGCTQQDLQTIFIAVNFEEESETVEAEANDDDAMMRFEFLEGIVRCAFGKYISSKKVTDASDAVGMLLEEVVASPDLPPEARVDPNTFRRERLYRQEVEDVLKEYWDLVNAMFKLYKAKDRAKFMWPEHFMSFLEANKLLGLATGVERREAKLIFGWSQALVTDELRRRQRAVSLTLFDFVEALARLADLLSAPSHEDLVAYFVGEGEEPPELDRIVYEYYKHVGDRGTDLKRQSAELVVVPSRPLAVKLRLLLEYLATSLRDAWGGKDVKDTAAKVLKMATYMSGGIERG